MMQMKLHKILFLFPLVALTACSDDDLDMSQTLSGKGKTPLEVTAVLEAKSMGAQTRAADKAFADGDELVAYLRHVTWDGPKAADAVDQTPNPRTSVNADQAPKLVTFTCTGSEAWNKSLSDIYPFKTDSIVAIDGTNSQQATGLTTTPNLYWDDFSNSASYATDLRTEKHYLQSYYGYCYNGGAPVSGTELDTDEKKAAGKIGWAVQTDQTSGFKTSDLLWSAEQTPVSYTHRDANADNQRPGLIIPYTHAMSKVTINVIAGDGFASTYDFASTAITLNDVRITCTANAPEAKLTYPTTGGIANVSMKPGDKTTTDSKPSRAFEAIIVPSVLTVGNTLATITQMDGNTYTIPVTESIVKNETTSGWGSQLGSDAEDVNNGTAQARPGTRADDATIPAGTGFLMKSGVHYKLNVTVNKTAVNVTATILDWEEVEAEGVSEIHFENDVKDDGNGTIAAALQDYGFDVYKSADKSNYGTRATHLKYNKTAGTWKYDPVIYWQGGTAEYFRALSNVKADATGTTANESLTMENGRDALWGTTAEADGYLEGQAVNPRTGDVPLKFYHAMSQITFYLEDALKDNSDVSARIDLKDATIQLTDLATGGTLDLDLGTITPASITAGQKTFSEDAGAVPARMGYFASKENGNETTYKEEVTLRNYIITPQTISDDAMVIITLADGTVYKAQLNKCTTEVTANGQTKDEYIKEWKRSNHYTYTIELGKETITFRALVEGWNPVEGGGKATLEWD